MMTSKTPPRGYGVVMGRVTGTTIHSSFNPTREETTYSPLIDYEYRVDGGIYRNQGTPSFRLYYHSEAQAQAKCNEYPVDQELVVYYRLKHPDVSTLSPSLLGRLTTNEIIAILFLVWLIILVLRFLVS